MKKGTIFSIAFIISITLISYWHCRIWKRVDIGKLAPGFTIQNTNLSDFKGKNIILYFFNVYCNGCEEEFKEIEKGYIDAKNKNSILISINVSQNRLLVLDVVKKLNLSFPVLFDTDGKVAKMYKISGFPTFFLINKKGIIKKKIMENLKREEITELMYEG